MDDKGLDSARVRFKVCKAESKDDTRIDFSHQNSKISQLSTDATDAEGLPLTTDEDYGHTTLFADDNRPTLRQVFRSMSVYASTTQGPHEELQENDAGYKEEKAEKAQKKAAQDASAKLGTIMGVFLPCCQNIFGVLFFIRLSWIVGTAGMFQGFFVVLICCCVTFLTSLSLSAIATNGIVPGGGPYYMISRNLGPELGGAVGILFYLGTAIAAAMYIIGAVEIFMIYIVPESKILDDKFMVFRLYGTLLLLMLGCIVFAGVKVVNKFALPTIAIVFLCIAMTFIGGAVKFNGSDNLKFCLVGERVPNLKAWIDYGHPRLNCTAEDLQQMFCMFDNETGSYGNCDSYFEENKDKVVLEQAIPGIASGAFKRTFWSKYLNKGDYLERKYKKPRVVIEEEIDEYDDEKAESKFATVEVKESVVKYIDKDIELTGWVTSDIMTSFIILVGVFFPSATGIMAGSNRSDALRDPSISIPKGTLAANLFTSFIYLAGVLLFGSSIHPIFIRDKFGDSAYGALAIAQLAEPHPKVILIGCLLSTIGAGMQSLTGAPRLMQAIAKDGVVPFLTPLGWATKSGEPLKAIFVTLIITEIGILIAQLESITALITQFFLMCYCSVNTACALQSLLKSPGWRPSFRYYHWSMAVVGAILCIIVMFISHWKFALLAIAIGAVMYKYIEFKGAEKEWGDGLRGLGFSAARYALLSLEDKPPHTKNWRPQILVLCDESLKENADRHHRLISFVAQLKAGKGLTVCAAVLQGDRVKQGERAKEVYNALAESIKNSKLRGFCDVAMTHDKLEGISSVMQTSGLGALRHNTIVLPWPDDWSVERNYLTVVHEFVDTIRIASSCHCAILIPRSINYFPLSSERLTGTLDVWWVVHDGGMLMLLPFLLQKNRVWAKTKLRIFTVAQIDDNSVKMKKDLETFLYHLRINASVEVIEMTDSDISEYTYERTMKMEERYRIVQELHMKRKETMADPQIAFMDQVNKRKVSSTNLSNVNSPDTAESTKLSDIAEHGDQETPHGTGDVPQINISPDPSDNQADDEQGNGQAGGETDNGNPKLPYMGLKPYNVRRMHTAVKLNETIRSKSSTAQLIILNLPGPPKHRSDQFYMEFVDALTEGLDRVLLVKGTGTEVVTIYS